VQHIDCKRNSERWKHHGGTSKRQSVLRLGRVRPQRFSGAAAAEYDNNIAIAFAGAASRFWDVTIAA
jgi:hypothetical protein